MQANDFGAYQELLRVQGGAETQGERYEVITKFLNETEDYLHGRVAFLHVHLARGVYRHYGT